MWLLRVSSAGDRQNAAHQQLHPIHPVCFHNRKGVGDPIMPSETKVVKGAKNGQTRTVERPRATRFYPADDIPQPKKSRKPKSTKVTLRSSIVPGTVLILLSGRFRGKRVVFLKQLEESGLLLVTGPHKVNGVPLRRVNQSYVIATSTKVDLSGVKVDPKFNDAYFKREKTAKSKATAEELLDKKPEEKKALPQSRISDQKEVDKAIIGAIKKTPLLKAYLRAAFALSKGQFPHAMKF
ncbi:hypothetical protein SeMB42_g05942 [Synchytrium endobioticum]|uniref:60S ribosomal protein L6 n=1 Tax=Synchytrium endobioticum TaxID=286115 RepID=A0A507CN57_9FUNG|nr:hypothetical protein SeMB42_g05942 [Synchytrium endobioticum]TPX48078.1 hypothetical protein SeLEV6574_g02250 [Synchytrium endobioticum]